MHPQPQARATPAAPTTKPLLEVVDLKVSFRAPHRRWLPVIDTANLSVEAGAAVGIVGESGSAKTMLCRTLIGTLARHGARIVGGQLLFNGAELARAGERTWRQIRGRQIGYVPQSSLAGLNPVLTVGTQLMESIQVFEPMSRRSAEREAIALLERVQIARAKQVFHARSHELSGGMRQRVMIAAAIAQKPLLLLADEPTTALDVTVQRDILTLLTELRRELGMTLILISHDLAVIEEVCERMVVMYAGATIESGAIDVLMRESRHPYTRSLRASRVDRAVPGEDIQTIPGDAVSVGAWPEGCRFWKRCWLAADICKHGAQPPLMPAVNQLSACIRWEALDEHDRAAD